MPGETRLQVALKIIAALREAHLPPVYGFVNGVRIEEQPANVAVLQAWRAAGNPPQKSQLVPGVTMSFGDYQWNEPHTPAVK